jgi:hypothetical protein
MRSVKEELVGECGFEDTEIEVLVEQGVDVNLPYPRTARGNQRAAITLQQSLDVFEWAKIDGKPAVEPLKKVAEALKVALGFENAANPSVAPVQERQLEVSGNTYPVRDQLKELGGKWDPKRKVWKFADPAKAAEAQKLVAAQGKKPGGYRPWGAGGLCAKCGDDCGGTAWSCGYE